MLYAWRVQVKIERIQDRHRDQSEKEDSPKHLKLSTETDHLNSRVESGRFSVDQTPINKGLSSGIKRLQTREGLLMEVPRPSKMSRLNMDLE